MVNIEIYPPDAPSDYEYETDQQEAPDAEPPLSTPLTTPFSTPNTSPTSQTSTEYSMSMLSIEMLSEEERKCSGPLGHCLSELCVLFCIIICIVTLIYFVCYQLLYDLIGLFLLLYKY